MHTKSTDILLVAGEAEISVTNHFCDGPVFPQHSSNELRSPLTYGIVVHVENTNRCVLLKGNGVIFTTISVTHTGILYNVLVKKYPYIKLKHHTELSDQ